MQIRLFVDTPLFESTDIVLTDDKHHYLRNVLRADIGTKLYLFNGKDGEFTATLSDVAKKETRVRVMEKTKPQEFPAPVRLFFAPLKRDCTDWLAEKATELGVTTLCPVITDFTTTSRVNEDRLRAIATEAAEQSRRLTIPEIQPLRPLNDVLNNWKKEDGILFHADESGDAVALKTAFSALSEMIPVSFLIGPEGGFSAQERILLKRYDFVRSISLGRHILRAETAAITALAAYLCR